MKRQKKIRIIVILVIAALLLGIAVVSRVAIQELGGNDPHAGHDHAQGGQTTVDPHAGHDHGTTKKPDTGVLTYNVYSNADKTYRVVVRDAAKKTVFERDKMYNAPIKEDLSEDLFTLSWATDKGPNDFEYIFCNKKTGAVSQAFRGAHGFDGVRVAYPSDDETTIIVQDIFDKKVYYKEYPLKDAYTEGKYVVVGGKLQADKKTVRFSYIVDEKGSTRQAVIKLYE